MPFKEWVENIGARREAAKQARIDAKAEAARRAGQAGERSRTDVLAEEAKAGLAGAILAEIYNEQRITDVQKRIAKDKEMKIGDDLKAVFGEYEKKQAGGKN